MKRILIIEDETSISDFIKNELEYEGYSAIICADGKEGLNESLNKDYDLIILDLMLPTLNGFEVCRRLKKEKDTPIIMLSAKDSVMDKVAGLQIGADDYLAKPFAIEELLARINVIFRRKENSGSITIKFKDLLIDQGSRVVKKEQEELNLTTKEYELLVFLINNQDRVVSRDSLLENIWGYDYDPKTNVVDVYIRYLRNKLNPNDKEEYIQTIRSVGYIMRS
ncbi:response regulator transcription factor [Tissierella creatinophila]|uniref:Response regulator ArlR n=1 Tax=Tissierella creatinophila DSM 6911 TaxID=1123403 RepID=A0A1U7M8F0_TISCR|nr:response regulator transcription factor [Tissierella creatinophila]OLS03603.1 response regulator ArlR [Tissierella creatinophila DSM 6911]